MQAGRARAIGKACLHQVPPILGVLLLIGAIYVVQKEFRHLRLRDIEDALHDIPLRALAIGFLWTVLSYAVLTIYDRLGTIYAGHKVSYGRVAFASFCAYALSHNLGFAAVSGAAVRYRLYAHWGLTPLQIAKTVAFCSLTFALGGMVLGGTILFLEPQSIPFFGEHMPAAVMYAVGALLWAIVIGYVTLSRVFGSVRLFGYEIGLPGWRMAIVQVVLATVDVAITASIFYALLPPTPHLTWPIFLGVYVASYTAGLAANLPGGIGVFDTAILLGLEPYVSAPHIVGAIVVFRLYYYVIPLFLAGALFTGNEILLRGSVLLRRAERMGALARWSEPDFAVASATGLVALSGVMLLCVGVLAPQPDFSWIDPDFAEMANQAGQFIPSLIGAGLIVVALGLSQRVNLAWGTTIFLLVVGAAFTATQMERMWISGVLVVVVMLVAPLRRCFYRHASLLSGPLEASSAISLFALVICLLALAGTRPRVHLMTNNAWWVGGDVARGAAFAAPDRGAGGGAGADRDLALAAARQGALAAMGRRVAAAAGAAGRHHPAGEGRRRRAGRGRTGRHSVPSLRPGAAWTGRSDGRGGGPRLGDLATARSGAAGGTGPGVLACRPGTAEGVWRPGADRAAARTGRAAAARIGRMGRRGVGSTWCALPRRDLKTLLPLLPQLATNQDIVPAAA